MLGKTLLSVVQSLRTGLAVTLAIGLTALFLTVLFNPSVEAQEGSATPTPRMAGLSETSTPPLIGGGDGEDEGGQVSAQSPPSAPGRPSVTGVSHSSISLGWGAVSGATHYDARYRNRDAGGPGVPGSWSQTNGISGTSETFSGLSASTRYEFEVRAGNNAGDSGWSPNRYATTIAVPPSLTLPDPQNRSLTQNVWVSFTLPLASGGTSPYTYSVSGLPTGLSFTSSNRTVSGTPTALGASTVTYSVTDSASASRQQTFTITVTTSPPPSAPARPTVTGTTESSVSLSWGAVTGATHYDARYRNRDGGGPGVPGSWSQTNGISGTSETFSGLSASTRYEFEVRAGNNAGDSAWSPSRYATTNPSTPTPTPTPIPPTPTPPPPSMTVPPTGLTLVLESDGDLRLDYTESALGKHYFELHRSTTLNGTYTRHLTRNDNTSPARWATPAEGYYYKARGKSCPRRHNVNCPEATYPWSSWSSALHIPSTTVPTTASLSPSPSSADFTTDGSVWHKFTLTSNKNIKVVANPSGAPALLEMTLVSDEDRRTNACPSEGEESRERGNGDIMWFAGCAAGTGKIELRDTASGAVVTSYTITVEDEAPAPINPPTSPTRPSMPKISKGVPSATNKGWFILDWASTNNTNRYEVLQLKGKKYTPLSSLKNEVSIDFEETTAVVLGLKPTISAHTYRFKIRAINTSTKEYTDSGSFFANLLPAPRYLAGAYTKYDKITLTWDAVANPDATYTLEQQKKISDGNYTLWQELPTNDGITAPITVQPNGNLQAIVSPLERGGTYRYRVNATSVQGTSPLTLSKDITVTDERPTGSPSDLKIEYLIGKRGIRLSWFAGNVQNETGYDIEAQVTGESHTSDPGITKTAVSHESDNRKVVAIFKLKPNKEYTFRVYPKNDAGRSKGFGSKTMTIAPPTYLNGHQADHTVKYKEGTIDLAIIKDAITPAAKAWNAAMTKYDLHICNDFPTSNADRISCNNKNDDSKVVTIKTVETTKTTTTAGCTIGAACVRDFNLYGDAEGIGQSLGNMNMVFEFPAYHCNNRKAECGNSVFELVWTTVSSDHDKPAPSTAPGGGQYVYIGYIMLHEFGHPFGLPDFSSHGDLSGVTAIMNRVGNLSGQADSIKVDQDIAQLYAIYARHERH